MLSIIIVNYFGKEILRNCIESVVKFTMDIDYEIIIVDNSNDTITREMLNATNKNLIWLSLDYNAGFGRACNYAFSKMKGDVALLLNPDCVVADNAIGDCYTRFTTSEFVACGVQLLNEDGSTQISGNYAMKGGLNYLLPLPYIGSFIKAAGTLAKVKKPHADQSEVVTEVDWITGAFLMVKKDIIDVTGGFDEDFFLYAEEAEWCSRIKKNGSLVIFNNIRVLHLMGALSTEAFGGESNSYYSLHDKKGLQIMLSNLVRIRKEFGLRWYLVISFFYYISVPTWMILGILHSILSFKNRLKHFGSYAGNILKLSFYTPNIIKDKPFFYKVL